MIKSIKIAPSILSADFGKLNQEIAEVEPYCDWIHVDVMDGHFVPNITIGPVIVKSIKSKLPLDCHLMIENPEKYIEAFVSSGADHITIHQETCDDLLKIIKQIKDLKVKAGVSINPATSLKTIKHVIDKVDLVLIMSVNPGFGGQKFMLEVLEKISELRAQNTDLDIVVDGGINEETAKLAVKAGANVLVAGSYIFGAKDRCSAIAKLKNVKI